MPRGTQTKRANQSNLIKARETKRRRYHNEDAEDVGDIAPDTALVDSRPQNEDLLDEDIESDIISDSEESDNDSIVIPEEPLYDNFYNWKDTKSDLARITYTRGPDQCRVTKWRQQKVQENLRAAATGSINIQSMFARLK